MTGKTERVDFCEQGKGKQLEMWVTILWVVMVTPSLALE